ncbi:MAG: hypothetical protein ACREFP_02305 [Acetobacteraceae bacterium]
MKLLARLAVADLWSEKALALCVVLAIASVLAPLLVLAGLRAGVIAGLRAQLLATPTAREIISVGNREIPARRLAALARRPDVSFLVPRFRTLAMSLDATRADGQGGAQPLELIPSAPTDPLLEGHGPAAPASVVLSASAAARLDARAGTRLRLVLARVERDGARHAVRVPVTVQDVAPAWSFERPAAFVAAALAAYVEDYQDGLADPPAKGAIPSPHARKYYAGFRLFARRLRDVPGLAVALEQQGLPVVSHEREVASLLALDRNLGLLLTFVAGLGGIGYLIALGASLWAAVERKRQPFAMLRFLGLSAWVLAAMPALEAVLLGAAGVVLALAGAEGLALVINRAFAESLAGRSICTIGAGIVARGLIFTLIGAALAAGVAGWRLARIQPWEEMR